MIHSGNGDPCFLMNIEPQTASVTEIYSLGVTVPNQQLRQGGKWIGEVLLQLSSSESVVWALANRLIAAKTPRNSVRGRIRRSAFNLGFNSLFASCLNKLLMIPLVLVGILHGKLADRVIKDSTGSHVAGNRCRVTRLGMRPRQTPATKSRGFDLQEKRIVVGRQKEPDRARRSAAGRY